MVTAVAPCRFCREAPAFKSAHPPSLPHTRPAAAQRERARASGAVARGAERPFPPFAFAGHLRRLDIEMESQFLMA